MTRIIESRVTLSIAVLMVVSIAIAHEGHAPLPTKGVQVDIEKGLLTLSPEAHKALGVQFATVEQRALEEKALAYATLMPPWQQQYFVNSRLAGRITRLHIQTGQRVSARQLLAEIASPEFEAIQLELRSAMNNLDLSEKQLERVSKLAADQIIAERELIEATTVHAQSRNAVEIARNKLATLGLDTESIDDLIAGDAHPVPLPIYSPIDGTVNHTDLSVGKVVAANEHLFEVNDLSNLWVRMGVLERDVRNVTVGQSVELRLTAFSGEQFSSVVTASSFYVDPKSHVATIWAEIANPMQDEPRFLPGMYGLARIITSEPKNLLTIPSAALLGSGAERYVLVEVASTSKGHEYRRQNVVVAAQNATYVQLRGGELFPGDRVVTSGAHVLSSFFILGVLRLSPEGIRNIGLRVEPVQERVVEEVLEFDGQIDLPPERRATISSQVTGTLHRVLVDRGQKVLAGQIVAEVSSLEMQQTQLEMIRDHLEAELLESTLKRLKALGKGGSQIIAERRLFETENLYRSAANRRDSGRRTLLTLGITQDELEKVLESRQPLSALPLRSPIDGVVVQFDKVLGESTNEDEPLLEVHDLSHPWVQGFLSETEAARIRLGMSVRVRLIADSTFIAEATVVRSARMVSGNNRTVSVWLEFKEPPTQLLEDNLLARISATLSNRGPVTAVPLSAIVREGTRAYVFVQGDNTILDRRYVELGRSDDRYVEISRGLRKGENVAVQGVAELQTTYASIR